MNSSATTRRSARIASAFTVLVGLAVASAAGPAWSGGGGVLSGNASPHGYSLTDMASAIAPFTMSGNDPSAYPATPFQVLHVDNIDFQVVGSGEVATATQSFTVRPGTPLYVPVFNASDGPSVVGTFPATPADAPFNFFDPSQYGGTFEIVVDGSTTPLGADHLAGPVPVQGTERNIVTLGAFINPLSAGSHTVTVRGTVDGAALEEAHGITYIEFEFTYHLQVQSGA